MVQAEWQLIFVVRLAAQCSRLQRGVRKGLLSRLCRRCCLSLVGMQFPYQLPPFRAVSAWADTARSP